MPNKKSAERRARVSARKHLRNQKIISRLKTLQGNYVKILQEGDKEKASKALNQFNSALDKAVKVGTVHRTSASRRKSRMATRLTALAS